jgi:hypothetical protein
LKNIPPAITDLFAGPQPGRRPLIFSWRLVRRKNLPFLLLPEKTVSPAESFALYSAHRTLAKLWRALAPLILRTPLAKFYDRVVIEADAESKFLQFLAQQSGLPAGQMPAPAIKFGGVAGKTTRLVLLLRDAGGNPIRVVKVGLNPAGRAATEREASLLDHLPKQVIGCTGITGRHSSATMSAFATAYFWGKSLDNDVGIEKLFHDWLSDGPPEPIKNLSVWRELQSTAKGAGLPEWPILRETLAEHPVLTTIYHGDFAPWNVRMMNLENIRAFDWERGHLKGIPAWDWFHFIVQTSILVKRYAPERVAAELEQLVQAPRFQKYAGEAGISKIVEPLLLAYLLEQKLVVRPLEGSEKTDQLFRLLWVKWQGKESAGKPAPAGAGDHRIPARQQMAVAFAKLANLFWEPSLSPVSKPPLSQELSRNWLVMLAASLWIGGVVALQSVMGPHLNLVPLSLIPCLLPALKGNRRVGLILACVAALANPLMRLFKRPLIMPEDVICWNMAMRILVFSLLVILLDNARKQMLRDRSNQSFTEPNANQSISGNWAVLLITGIFFTLVVVLDVMTSPFANFLPLYLLPCMVLTLTLNWRWGTVAAVMAAIAGPFVQRFEDPGYQHMGIEIWNTIMRLVIFETVVLLLDRIRRENILYSSIKNHLITSGDGLASRGE